MAAAPLFIILTFSCVLSSPVKEAASNDFPSKLLTLLRHYRRFNKGAEFSNGDYKTQSKDSKVTESIPNVPEWLFQGLGELFDYDYNKRSSNHRLMSAFEFS